MSIVNHIKDQITLFETNKRDEEIERINNSYNDVAIHIENDMCISFSHTIKLFHMNSCSSTMYEYNKYMETKTFRGTPVTPVTCTYRRYKDEGINYDDSNVVEDDRANQYEYQKFGQYVIHKMLIPTSLIESGVIEIETVKDENEKYEMYDFKVFRIKGVEYNIEDFRKLTLNKLEEIIYG